jgi:hypothetical protein
LYSTYHLVDKTFIQTLFEGQIQPEVKCLHCGVTRKIRKEPFTNLQLAIKDIGVTEGRAKSVDEAIREHLFASSPIDGTCQLCAVNPCQVDLTYSIVKAPNVLTVCLKRWQMADGTKLNNHVRFKFLLKIRECNGESGTDVTYHLIGVIVHKESKAKSSAGGHYIACVKVGRTILHQLGVCFLAEMHHYLLSVNNKHHEQCCGVIGSKRCVV